MYASAKFRGTTPYLMQAQKSGPHTLGRNFNAMFQLFFPNKTIYPSPTRGNPSLNFPNLLQQANFRFMFSIFGSGLAKNPFPFSKRSGAKLKTVSDLPPWVVPKATPNNILEMISLKTIIEIVIFSNFGDFWMPHFILDRF